MTTDQCYVGIQVYYDGKGRHIKPENATGGKPVGIKVTGQALAGGVWEDGHATGVSSASGDLKPRTDYAVSAINAYSAAAGGVRLSHPDFDGLKPGGGLGVAINQMKNRMSFAKLGFMPVFNSSAPLFVECLDETTSTPVIWLELIELPEGAAVESGCLDAQAGGGAVTDGGAVTKLTAITPGSLTIKSGYGRAFLRGMWSTGTAPLRTQLRSTDNVFQPGGTIEIAPMAVQGADGDLYHMFPLPELTPESLIDTYASS